MRQLIALTFAAAVLLFIGAGRVAADRQEHGRLPHGPPRAFVLPFGRTMAVCAGQFIPDGWALADTQAHPAACGAGSFNNVWLLMDLHGAAPGQSVILCQGPVPDGWFVTGSVIDTTRCGGTLAGALNNLMTVRKL